MGTSTRILLYGNSLVLDGIGASLRLESRFELIRLPRSLPDSAEVDRLAPDVIVFDVASPGSAFVFSALENRPDLLILGVSPDDNVVRLWSGREYRELSSRELAALIEDASSSALPQESARSVQATQ